MERKTPFKLSAVCHALVLLGLIPQAHAGQNFLITPSDILPTTVAPGSTVTALFTVQNLTNVTRNGFTIQGLPNTVVQNSSGGYCSNPINLAPLASCTMALDVSGAVNISDFAICNANSCTTVAIPLNVAVVNAPSGLFVAAGSYVNNSAANLPLLAVGNSDSVSYPSSIISNLPTNPTYVQPTFNSASCTGSTCIAVGNDNNDGNQQYLLVAMSQDAGVTWTYPIGDASSFPNDYNYPPLSSSYPTGFNSASCNQDLCISVGSYEVTSNFDIYPLIAQYINGSWSYAVDSTNPPNNLGAFGGYFLDSSCSGTTCVAAGAYEDSITNSYYPLLAQTTDGGTTWTYELDDQSVLPAGFAPTETVNQLNGASCASSICVAVGYYFDNINFFQHQSLAQSTNGGAWAYSIDSATGPQISDFSGNGIFKAASCTDSVCVAVGSYENSSAATYPMLVVSQDNGASWSYAIDAVTGPQPSQFQGPAAFNSVSCSGNVCVAAGYYGDTSFNYVPLLAQSTDAGSTWSYVIDAATGPTLPGLNTPGIFNTASCNGNTCIAAGYYTDSISSTQYPMLAQSVDGGAWTYVIDNNAATLPADYSGLGIFYGSSQ